MLKETGEVVGIVDDVYSVGERDLLKVRRTDLKAAGKPCFDFRASSLVNGIFKVCVTMGILE